MSKINQLIQKIIQEVSSMENARTGAFVPPIQPGLHKFEKSALGPFIEPVSNFDSPELAHDSYDGKVHTPSKKAKKLEKKAERGRKYVENNFDFYTIGEEIIDEFNSVLYEDDYEVWGSGSEGGSVSESLLNKDILIEDLAVWFGTKKKPKGSKQPKGPWVNICRKVDGKHPPCGRPDTSKGAYPKCRAAGVAGKMSDSQKRAACAQKRRAEKSDTQSGKGQKPVMTSYKPRKESINKKKVLTEKFKIEPSEREKIYEDDNFLLVIPLTHAASCKYGANTKWCTSSSDDTMFNKHNKMGSLGYLIIKDKDLQEKLDSSKFGIYMNKPGENYLGGRYPGPDGLIFYDEKNDILPSNKIMNLFDRYDLYGKFMNVVQKFVTYSFDKFKKMDNTTDLPKH